MENPRAAALIVTSDHARGADLTGHLAARQILVELASDTKSALERFEARPFEIVLVDWSLPNGAEKLMGALARKRHDTTAIALVRGDVTEAADAMRAGAADVLPIDVGAEGLDFALDKALAVSDITADEPPPASIADTDGLIGESKPMRQLAELITKAAPKPTTVLIRGESGTGKELVAHAIHRLSGRGDKPLVLVHCSALPETLLESELFGHEKGAFTGAIARRPGRVEVADGGTLFLDEIGDVTPGVQVKLLRLLQEKEFEPLGSTQTRRADVRFVAATHRDLEGMIKRGEFREDLYYRLNVVPIWLPPLRARRGDVAALAKHFAKAFGDAIGRPGMTLSEEAITLLQAQRWPGNVRQLQHFVERLIVLSDDDQVGPADVERELSQAAFPTQMTKRTGTLRTADITRSQIVPLSEEVRTAEKKALERALKHTRGNRTLAARLLGISRATLYNKLQEYGLMA
jgi:DNA-binding NtrC family response regulator